MPVKIYISGPVSGLPEGNKPAFDKVAANLFSSGLAYFNPQDVPPHPESMTDKDEIWRYYMRRCVKEIPDCTQIWMLPGWQASKGANWEFNIAVMLGLQVVYL
jgi:hypothetical protein